MNSSVISLSERVFPILAAIPAGKVTTYGTIALLAGSPRAARQIGGILCRLPEETRLPWHRVVNRMGKISQQGNDYQRQYSRLLAEGIQFDSDGRIDLKIFGWCP